MHELVTGPSGAVCFIAALRALWLLPDWLAKWQSLTVSVSPPSADSKTDPPDNADPPPASD